MSTATADALLPRRELRKLVKVSDMTIFRWRKDGIFPEPIKINGRNYWRSNDVASWIENQTPSAA